MFLASRPRPGPGNDKNISLKMFKIFKEKYFNTRQLSIRELTCKEIIVYYENRLGFIKKYSFEILIVKFDILSANA